MRFPNKVIADAYEKAIGKTFTHSPSFKRFSDQNGESDYNYHAMVWLMDNGILEQLPMTMPSIVFKYKVKHVKS